VDRTCGKCGKSMSDAARFCPSCAAPVEIAAPSEERKLATVLFADLVGSTQLAGAEDPERVRVILDQFYDTMAVEIEQAGGTIEKFVGDAVMAAFGAPVSHEDDPERALHAALAMRRRLGEVFGDRLALRIGVNTGEVVVGRPREGSSFVTGDAVNVGARLEQAAAAGEILVGERTVAAAGGAFEFAEPTTVEAKGKPGGVACRRLVRALSLMRPRGVGGLRRVFVGRETEVERLQSTYQAIVKAGEPHLMTILGDAGVGKTRLLRELWRWLAGCSPEPLRRTGRCLSYGHGITYWPLAEVLKEHFGILESDSADAVALAIADHPFLGLTLGLKPPVDVHPLVARERLHDSWVEFVENMARERPTVLVVEDLHWAEDDLCDLLETLVAQVRAPLLLLVTARPELFDRRPTWGRPGRNATQLLLESLPPAGAGELLDALLGTEPPASVRQVIIDRAEGNPFFVEELIATLIDRGVLRHTEQGWSFGELPPDFDVPDSVQAVLTARIDLLPKAEKTALQAASVIGRVFWTGPVYELLAGAQPDFGLLEERDFIRRRQGSSLSGEREYVIKHALTREVAYASLPKGVRGHRHAAFAGWLERTGVGRDEHAPLLAYHYTEAVRPEDVDLAWQGRDEEAARLRGKAVVWLRRAADLAIGRYEIDHGLSLLHQALGLESEPRQQADIWHAIGHANALKFDGPPFREAMERAIALGGPPAELYSELALQGVRRSGMWIRRYDPELLDGWVDQALELSPEGSPTYPRALAAKALRTNDETAARELQAVARRLGDHELGSHALAALTNVAWRSGDLDSARALVEQRLDLLAEVSAPDDRHFALMQAVEVNLAQGRLSAAAQSSSELSEMVAGLTAHHRLHGIYLRLRAEALAGRWGTVRPLTPAAEQAAEANATTPCAGNVSVLLWCALASARCGDAVEAYRLAAKADAIGIDGFKDADSPRLMLARSLNDIAGVQRLVDVMQPVVFAPFEFDRAAALLDAFIALGDTIRIESDAPAWSRPGTYVEPFALRALGVARRDSQLLAAAADRFAGMGLDWHAAETRSLRW
jgi:class 3 adenylate cyclase